jgi:DNA-binding NtrC family response regulator
METPMKILIVDDEVDLVSTLVERLEIRGIEAIGVQTGAQALEQVQTNAFDVVIQDVKLKGEDGVEVMQRIKHIKPDLPVILLTGHMSAEASEEGFRAGAIDYLIKPISLDDLILKMKAAIAVYVKK